MSTRPSTANRVPTTNLCTPRAAAIADAVRRLPGAGAWLARGGGTGTGGRDSRASKRACAGLRRPHRPSGGSRLARQRRGDCGALCGTRGAGDIDRGGVEHEGTRSRSASTGRDGPRGHPAAITLGMVGHAAWRCVGDAAPLGRRRAPRQCDGGRARAARDATYRFLHAIGGDLPGFEEVSRALFADDQLRMEALMVNWPADVRGYAQRLLST